MTPYPKPTEALKPCPSCNGTQLEEKIHEHRNLNSYWTTGEVRCRCGFSAHHGSIEAARSLWNTRATDRDAELAAMRERLELNHFAVIDLVNASNSEELDTIQSAVEKIRSLAVESKDILDASTAGTELLERLRVAVEERDQARIERDTKQQFRQRSDAKLAAAESESAGLRKALEPFADIDGEGNEDFPDDTKAVLKVGRQTHYALTLGDIRRAASALGDGEKSL